MDTPELLALITAGVARRPGRAPLSAIRILESWEPTMPTPAPPTYPPSDADLAAARIRDGKGLSTHHHLTVSGRSAVMIDSIPSQANRMEQAILEARRAGELTWPTLAVDIHGKVMDALEAPHRHLDAWFVGSAIDGVKWADHPVVQSLLAHQDSDITAMGRWSPGALIFGRWDSYDRGQTGGLADRQKRIFTSKMLGVRADDGDVNSIAARALRTDRVLVNQGASFAVADATSDGIRLSVRAKGKDGKVSAFGGGSIISSGSSDWGPWLGADADLIHRWATISFPELRGWAHGGHERTDQAKALIVCAAFLADELAFGGGYVDLRSRCQLVRENRKVELIGGSHNRVEIDVDPFALYKAALEACPVELGPTGESLIFEAGNVITKAAALPEGDDE